MQRMLLRWPTWKTVQIAIVLSWKIHCCCLTLFFFFVRFQSCRYHRNRVAIYCMIRQYTKVSLKFVVYFYTNKIWKNPKIYEVSQGAFERRINLWCLTKEQKKNLMNSNKKFSSPEIELFWDGRIQSEMNFLILWNLGKTSLLTRYHYQLNWRSVRVRWKITQFYR